MDVEPQEDAVNVVDASTEKVLQKDSEHMHIGEDEAYINIRKNMTENIKIITKIKSFLKGALHQYCEQKKIYNTPLCSFNNENLMNDFIEAINTKRPELFNELAVNIDKILSVKDIDNLIHNRKKIEDKLNEIYQDESVTQFHYEKNKFMLKFRFIIIKIKNIVKRAKRLQQLTQQVTVGHRMSLVESKNNIKRGGTVDSIKYPTKTKVKQILKEDCEAFFGKNYLEEIHNTTVSDGKNIMEIYKNMSPDHTFVDGKLVPLVIKNISEPEPENKDNDYIFVEKKNNDILSENYKILNVISQLSEIEMVFLNEKTAKNNGIQGLTSAEKEQQKLKWENRKTMKTTVNRNSATNKTTKTGIHTLADFQDKKSSEKSSDDNKNLVHVTSRTFSGGKHKKKNFTTKKNKTKTRTSVKRKSFTKKKETK